MASDNGMTLDDKLQNLRDWLTLYAGMQADAEARHNREMAEFRAGMAELRASQAKTEGTLRRAVRLGALEIRNERKRRQELDQRLTQRIEDLAAQTDHRHQELENLLRKFLERGGNGQH